HNSGGYDYSNTEITFLTKPSAVADGDLIGIGIIRKS
ncbi:unnamed protein product, partial [marine sediment metagenome]